MKIKSPCYKCISYAMCVNKHYVMCDQLHYVISNGSISERVSTIAIMKCLGLRVYRNTDKVEFVRDYKEIWVAVMRRMRDSKPKYLRFVVILGFCYYRVKVRCLAAAIPVVEKVEYVRDLLKGRHIWD